MTSDIPQPQAATTKERCAVCGAEIPDLGVYCPNCGAMKASMQGKPLPYAPSWTRTGWAPFPQKPPSKVRPVFKAIAAGLMITLIAWVLVSFASMIYGIGIVVPDIQNNVLGSLALFVAVPYLVIFAYLSGTALVIYYFLLIAAITASISWIFISSVKGYTLELTMKAKSRDHSPIFEISALLFATFFLNFVIVLVSGATNSSTPTEETDAQLLLTLANASVWEELVVRVLLIGIPLIFIDLVRRKRRTWHSYILGGNFKIGIPETALIVLSASIFGVAHYLGGWGEWKIPAAGIVGVAFGYLFLRYGLAASIMLHFIFDYMSVPWLLFGDSYMFALGILLWIWLAAGVVFTAYYIIRIVEFATGVKFWEERARPVAYAQPYPMMYQTQPWVQQPWPGYGPPYPPPPQGQPPSAQGGYVCPNCAGLEARWVNGRFQCLRCGHLS